MFFSFPNFSQVFLISLPTQPYVLSLLKKQNNPHTKWNSKQKTNKTNIFLKKKSKTDQNETKNPLNNRGVHFVLLNCL